MLELIKNHGIKLLVAAATALLLAELLVERHAYLAFANWPGFHAGFGLLLALLLGVLGPRLARLLMRETNDDA